MITLIILSWWQLGYKSHNDNQVDIVRCTLNYGFKIQDMNLLVKDGKTSDFQKYSIAFLNL